MRCGAVVHQGQLLLGGKQRHDSNVDDLIHETEKRATKKKTPLIQIGLSAFVYHTALAILSLSNMSYDLAFGWLLDKRRKGLNVPDNITATPA